MASQRHLKDLLEEDQEPFQLQSYISDRRCQINRPVTHLQVKKRRPISQNAGGLPSRFCRNACFFSLRESPDPRKSPLFELKSPNRSQNAIFVNIPARTASILLEAAVRIQKQSSEGSKTRTRNAANAFGIFGSVLKKLTHRKKREINNGKDGGRVSSSVKDMLRWESPVVRKIVTRKSKRKEEVEEENVSSRTHKAASETQFSRRSSSSGVWSESVTNGERSWDVDFDTSSSRSNGSDEFPMMMNGEDFSEEKRYCESPFHFVLQTMPSNGGFRTPNFSSPAASPRHDCLEKEKKKESYEVEKLKKLEMEEEEEEEEDKEQSSPVSVLDPPFQDDDEDIHMDDNNIPSSFRSVQKAKHLLLQKLCRFEQLAGLDPTELEKRLSEQESDEEEEEEEEDMKCLYHCEIITQRVLKTYFEDMNEVPQGIEALISDLAAEELQNDIVLLDDEAVADMAAKRVCERLRSWRDVESNTIDMMVEHDFRTESLGLWRSKNDAEVAETVMDIEFEIFEDLVEELSEDIGGNRW
ncbi:hypothetical protein CARUB_v10000706mg [Capsella rubella]|uniref:DUF4378 domain-containing protein n=1 Tax=Capsella rubella TaxID=81985 RepID=R0GU35_9BRAS|nr:uncharacterized protein LOC17881549 [Capsella rubella]EOA20394.1 hypothetical protein CARUB_v10000706mg [Capsella rubella]